MYSYIEDFLQPHSESVSASPLQGVALSTLLFKELYECMPAFV
jgi:hypothetical protein